VTVANRQAPVTRQRLLDAAVDFVEREGLDALSLRVLAAELGVTPMVIYRHVRSKDALVDLVVEQLVERQAEEVEQRWPRSWQGRMRLLAEQMRAAFEIHPAVLTAVQRRALVGNRVLLGPERVLESLLTAGFSSEKATAAYSAVFTYVAGFMGVHQGRQAAREEQELTSNQIRAQNLGLLAALPDDYAAVKTCAPHLADQFDNTAFEAGLNLLIAGIATSAP